LRPHRPQGILSQGSRPRVAARSGSAQNARGAAMKRGKAAAHNAGAAAMLREFIADIEALEEEKAAIAERIRARKADAKACGFDTKVINQMLKERRMDRAEAEEFAALCEIYRAALGMLDGTPLGDAARKRLMGEARKPEEEGEEAPSPAAPAPPLDPAKT